MRPPLLQPIAWPRVRDTLWQWFTDSSGCETVWGNQAAPQPSYPYATMLITSGTLDLGARDETRFEDDGGMKIVGQRDFVLSCQVHVGPPCSQDGNANALGRMSSVLASLYLPKYIQQFEAVGLGLRERGSPQSFDVLVGAQWVAREQVDLRFGLASVVQITPEDYGWFDKVEISSDLQGSSLNLTDEIFDFNA